MRPTATQRKILTVLSDGKAHPRDELRDCLPDYLSDYRVLTVHICNIRKKFLRPNNEDIVCVLVKRRIYYQHVLLLVPSTNAETTRLTRTGVVS